MTDSDRIHPVRYSPEVIAVLRKLIYAGEHIHDPFAGDGTRLAALCDELGATFTGTDIERWQGRDSRVAIADAGEWITYPAEPFTIVTSPAYVNKRCCDYPNGPTPATKIKGRICYGIALGHAVHPRNLARFTGKPSKRDAYWSEHEAIAKHWGDRVIVNVDEPISDGWQELLIRVGYRIEQVIPAFTRRNGGFIKPNKGKGYEVVIVARRVAIIG
jgi:hypothetical protein